MSEEESMEPVAMESQHSQLSVGVPEEDSTALFIELIQHYPWLYNLQHADYKNNIKKIEGWTEISDILSLSVEEVQRRWKSLRDKYTREKRDKPSGSSLPEMKWEYFDKIAGFYEKCTRPRKTYSTTKMNTKAQKRPSSSCTTWDGTELLSPTPSNASEESGVTLIKEAEEVNTPRKTAKKGTALEENLLTVSREIADCFKNKNTGTGKTNPNRTCVEYTGCPKGVETVKYLKNNTSDYKGKKHVFLYF